MASVQALVDQPNKYSKAQQYLIIVIQEQFFGIEANCIIELIKDPKLQALPNTPKFIVGVLNLRGDILSVLELETILYGEFPPRKTPLSNYLCVIVKIKDVKFCYLVPEVLGIFSIEPHQLTSKFPFIPELHSTSSLCAITLVPLNDPNKEEIVSIIDIENLYSNRISEWNLSQFEEPSKLVSPLTQPELTEEELIQFELVGDDSFSERQNLELLEHVDVLIIQIGDFNFGIPLPFVKRVVSNPVFHTNEDKPPVLAWVSLEDSQIPVIDPRELLYAETPPRRPTNYILIVIHFDQFMFAITTDKVLSVEKAFIVDQNAFQYTMESFEQLNPSLVESKAHSTIDEQGSSLHIMKIPTLVQLLLGNESVVNCLSTYSEQKNE